MFVRLFQTTVCTYTVQKECVRYMAYIMLTRWRAHPEQVIYYRCIFSPQNCQRSTIGYLSNSCAYCFRIRSVVASAYAYQDDRRVLLSIGQNPLHQFPRSKSVTSWQLPRLRGSYGETCLVDFGRMQVTVHAVHPSYRDPGGVLEVAQEELVLDSQYHECSFIIRLRESATQHRHVPAL